MTQLLSQPWGWHCLWWLPQLSWAGAGSFPWVQRCLWGFLGEEGAPGPTAPATRVPCPFPRAGAALPTLWRLPGGDRALQGLSLCPLAVCPTQGIPHPSFLLFPAPPSNLAPGDPHPLKLLFAFYPLDLAQRAPSPARVGGGRQEWIPGGKSGFLGSGSRAQGGGLGQVEQC